jgi:hypothetical protein
VLLLRDDSLPSDAPPVGMYLHSRLVPLFAGPRPSAPAGDGPSGPADSVPGVPADTAVRFANVSARRAPASTGVPPRLLPAAEAVVVARDRANAVALLHHLPVSGVAQVLTCSRRLVAL